MTCTFKQLQRMVVSWVMNKPSLVGIHKNTCFQIVPLSLGKISAVLIIVKHAHDNPCATFPYLYFVTNPHLLSI